MTAMIQIGQIMDVEQGMIEDAATIVATIEAAIARPPMGVVAADAMMITATVIIGVMTAMDIAVEAVIVAAEEVYTLVA